MNIKAWIYLVVSLFCLWQIHIGYSTLSELVLNDDYREYTTLNLTYYDYDTGTKAALASPKYQEPHPYITKLELYNSLITTLNLVICIICFVLCFSWYIEENNIRLRDYLGKETKK